jgi:hypothetical protein
MFCLTDGSLRTPLFEDRRLHRAEGIGDGAYDLLASLTRFRGVVGPRPYSGVGSSLRRPALVLPMPARTGRGNTPVRAVYSFFGGLLANLAIHLEEPPGF